MAQLLAPKNGVTIRMYRHGHGDCYLLAFPRKDRRKKDPFYVMIDCGLKGGSQKRKDPADASKRIPALPNIDFEKIADNIAEATDKRIDLFIITHEHEDHVSGIKDKYFSDFHIDKAWFAWTEDPDDPLANELDRGRREQVRQLVSARHKLSLAVGDDNTSVAKLDNFIDLELGHEAANFNLDTALAAASGKKQSRNRKSMYLVRDKAHKNKGVDYLEPGNICEIEEAKDIRAFVLGPPKDKKKLRDEDPKGKEAFKGPHSHKHLSLAGALDLDSQATAPFGKYCQISHAGAFSAKSVGKDFYEQHYGQKGMGEALANMQPCEDNADWRRIDEEWLYAAENLAIKLNTGVNNSSLVLAFELPNTKKNLLFVGDAQRGNWISWTDHTWTDTDGTTLTAKDILNKTVLYKVGHHGSHNATLKGEEDSDYANLSWMGQGQYGKEFTAMINAVNAWALGLRTPWVHPLPSIKEALVKKSDGRVFQIDTDQPEKPENVSATTWKKFLDKCTFDDLYFDYTILDEFENA